MKSFKTHINEGIADGAMGVGTTTTNSVEDGSIGVHNIDNAEVLERVNAFVGSIAAGEYLRPQYAVDSLREKLNRIGLQVADVELAGESGSVTAEVTQFGGRFGKDTDGSDINDDGISHRKSGGLKLEINYERLDTGTSKVYAKLV